MSTLPVPDVSVVSPVYGSRDGLIELVDRVSAAVAGMGRTFEIVLVDDASPDGGWAVIAGLARTRPEVVGVRLSRNFGQHYAISAGIETARGNVVVVMDCDLQDLPEEIPRLVAAVGDGVEVVFAQRQQRQDTPLKRLSSWGFYRVLTWLTGVKQDHSTANFGAFSRKTIDVVNGMREVDRFFPLMVKWTGFRAVSIPVTHAPRKYGETGYSLARLLRLASQVVTSYSDKPLQLVMRIGLLFAMASFAMALLTVYSWFIGSIQVAGFTSIVASVWLVGGVTIASLGVVGAYVGKVFTNAKGRPYYIIAERIDAGGQQ